MTAPSILITQCLQNDFVRLIDRYEALPNLLHVGYDESMRLLGERMEEGPVRSMLHWAYERSPEELAAYQQKEIAKWAKVVKDSGAKAD